MKLNLHVFRFCFFFLAAITLTSCNNANVQDNESEYIGSYRSPFADTKVKLEAPASKIVQNSSGKKIRVAFDQARDAIPASVLIRTICAREYCQENSQSGRLTCAGLQKAVSEKWPDKIPRYSFTYEFEPGESPDDVLRKIESDNIDKECVVGVSNYAEFRVSGLTNDPDIQPGNAAYAASPYLDQIGFFDNNNSIATNLQGLSLGSPTPKASFKIGVIDGNFYHNESQVDVPGMAYFTGVQSYGNYNIDQGVIINIGGAPLPGSLPGDGVSGHGMFVTSLIAGQNNNSKGGAGVLSYTNSYYVSGTIVAANVYSVNANGEKTITIDDVNNALALMADLKVDVINMSLGTRMINPPETMRAAILAAIGSGSVVVVAAGNDGYNISQKLNRDGTPNNSQAYPAAWGADYYGLISVAAMNKAGTDLAAFSNFGNSNVEIAAPGEGINVMGKVINGTSFAAPLVTGAVAVAATYYKNKSIEATPAQIEAALLKGSVNLPSLDSRIKGGLKLHLGNLNTQLTTQSLTQMPTARLDNDGFWYTPIGTSMNYGIRTVTSNVDESDTSLYVGIWEKLDESLPPLAYVQARNGVDNFSLPFYQFLVGDEGVWIVLYRVTSDGKRKFLSSKLYKFTDLIKTPTIAESVVLGGINQVNKAVEGWACLNGRPEHLKIEARVGSPSGSAAFSVITDVQPKGREYYDACTPFTVMLGFQIPLERFRLNTSYYFVAVHPTDAAKNKLLSTDAFLIESDQSVVPVVSNLKKSIVGDNISVKGSVCWENQLEPGTFASRVINPSWKNNSTIGNWIDSIIAKEPVISALVAQKMIATASDPMYQIHQNWGIGPTKDLAENFSNSTTWIVNAGTPVQKPLFSVNGFGSKGIMSIASVFENGESKTWFFDQNQPNIDSLYGAAYDYEIPITGDISTAVVRNDSACTGAGKVGIGQDFTISTTRGKLLNRFNIAAEFAIILAAPLPAPYSTEYITAAFNNLNTLYKNELVTNGRNVINNLISSGDMNISIRLLTHSSEMTMQYINLKQVANLP